MSNLLKIRVTDECPNRESVLEHYSTLSKSSGYKGDSGIDLIFPTDVQVNVDTVKKIGLGIQCEMVQVNTTKQTVYNKEDNIVGVNHIVSGPDESKGYMLAPRSSISSTPLSMANSIGIIDAGYRGEIIVPVRCHRDCNHPQTSDGCLGYYTVKANQKLFQIVAFDGKPIRIEIVDKLSDSERGDKGFGSTNAINTNS